MTLDSDFSSFDGYDNMVISKLLHRPRRRDVAFIVPPRIAPSTIDPSLNARTNDGSLDNDKSIPVNIPNLNGTSVDLLALEVLCSVFFLGSFLSLLLFHI